MDHGHHQAPRRALAAIFLVAALPTAEAVAQSWPHEPCKLIVPFCPGSAADTTARLFAERLADAGTAGPSWRIGPGPTVSSRSRRSWARMMITRCCSRTAGRSPSIRWFTPSSTYDPERDLVPIVSASIPSSRSPRSVARRRLRRRVDRSLRAEPGKPHLGVDAGPAAVHLRGLPQARRARDDAGVLPNFSPALQDVAENRIGVAVTAPLPLLPFAKAGKVKLLLVTNRDRSPAAPDLADCR